MNKLTWILFGKLPSSTYYDKGRYPFGPYCRDTLGMRLNFQVKEIVRVFNDEFMVNHFESGDDDFELKLWKFMCEIDDIVIDYEPSETNEENMFLVQGYTSYDRSNVYRLFVTNGVKYSYPFAEYEGLYSTWFWDVVDRQNIVEAIKSFVNF